jgi:hypothetical protein
LRILLPILLCGLVLVPQTSALEYSVSTKSLVAAQKSSQTTSIFFFNRIRTQTEFEFSENCITELDYELFPSWIDSAKLYSNISIKNSNSRIYRIADLNHSITNIPDASDSTEHWQLEHNLDRALMRCQSGNWEYIIGRQAVTFGGMSVNPTDVFAPVSFKTLDQEFRPGVDALRIIGGLGETTEIEAGILTGKNADAEKNGVYLRSHFLLVNTDVTPLLAGFKKNKLLGLTLQSEYGQLGIVFDGAVIIQRKSAQETAAEMPNKWTAWTLGLNLQWNEKLFTMLDFHHNPMGTTKPSEYLNNAASVIYQEYPLALLGQDYLLPSLVYQQSPLLTLRSSVISNINDGSFTSSSQLEWSITEDSLLSGSLILASGKQSALSAEKHSEFGDSPNSFQLVFKHYL